MDFDFLARLHAVEKHLGGDLADIAIGPEMRRVIREHLRIHQIGRQFPVANMAAEFSLYFKPGFIQIDFCHHGSEPYGQRLVALEDLVLQALGKSAIRLTQLSPKKSG